MVDTCVNCNARMINYNFNSDCEFCKRPDLYSRKNDMSIGKLSLEEVALGEKAERMRLFKSLGDMTMMELNLIRAILPRLKILRLVYRGTGQFAVGGHAIALDNGQQLTVAKSLPNDPNNAAIAVICDPGKNYKSDPAFFRKFVVRRDLVVNALKMLLTLNRAYVQKFGHQAALDEDVVDALPQNGVPEFPHMVIEGNRDQKQPFLKGMYSMTTATLSAWLRAGEDAPGDYPLAARAFESIKDECNVSTDIHSLAQAIQGNPRSSAVVEMTRIWQIVNFFLQKDGVITADVSGLPKRPEPPRAPTPKSEADSARKSRIALQKKRALEMLGWDAIDIEIIKEAENASYQSGASSLAFTHMPSGFIMDESEEERRMRDLGDFAEKLGVKKVKNPPEGACILPGNGTAITESMTDFACLAYPNIFPLGLGDLNSRDRGKKLTGQQWLKYMSVQDCSVFKSESGYTPKQATAKKEEETTARFIERHLSLNSKCSWARDAAGPMMKRKGTASGSRFQKYSGNTRLRDALDTLSSGGKTYKGYSGKTPGGATFEDLRYDYEHDLLLIDGGVAEGIGPGLGGDLPAQTDRLFLPHLAGLVARREIFTVARIFANGQFHHKFQKQQLEGLLSTDGGSRCANACYFCRAIHNDQRTHTHQL